MLFNTFHFWIIFPALFILYWIIPSKYNKARNFYLILVSYLLYMNWKPAFALVLLGVTLVTYWGGQLLQVRDEEASIEGNKKKHLVWLFALLGLLPLLVFKYYNFLNNTISDGLAAVGLQFSLPGLNWAVPVGISFFTFQAVGYMLDVYHGRMAAEKNLLDYVLFVSFFPQIASGPISKADELLPQIKKPHVFDYCQGVQGLKYLLWGMFLKVALADRLGIFVDSIYNNYIHYSGAFCGLASVFYSFQIYGDFAGYSLMAVGLGKLLGFDLVQNFRQPYLATSVTDFWKRWHISLTRWLTQQVYIPLGGNRCSKARNYWNILVTFLVSGIWHGANWTFVLWGVIHGVFQIIEKALGLQKNQSKNVIVAGLRIIMTFFIVNLAWIFFRSPSIDVAVDFIGRIFTFAAGSNETGGITNMLIIFAMLFMTAIFDIRAEWFNGKLTILQKPAVRMAIYVFIFAVIISLGCLDGGQFIYVSF